MALFMMVVYLFITTFIGMRILKRNQSIADFLVAKRNLGVFLVAALFFGEALSGASSVGKATEGFHIGITAVWINWGTTVGIILLLIFGIGKFYRVLGAQRGIMSVPEAYRILFDKKTATIMMMIIVLVYIIIFSIQPLAAASVLGPMFGIDLKITAFIVGMIITAITFAGGLRGLASMNIVHSIVMFTGLMIVAGTSIHHAGGWSALKTGLPSTYFSILQPDIMTVLAWALGTGLSFLCAASIAGAIFGAKSNEAAHKGLLLAGIMIIPYAVMPALVGMAAKVAYPDIPASTVLFSMANTISPLMGGLVSIAVIAAIFSTAPSLILIIATTLTRDLFKGIIKPDATDSQQLIFSRSVVVGVGIAGTILGMNAGSILNTALGAFQIRAFAGLLLIIALYWPRVTKDAAFWSLLIGGGLAAVWHFAGNPNGIQPLWPSLAAGLLVLIVLTMVSKEPISPGFKRYQEILQEYNEQNESEKINTNNRFGMNMNNYTK